MVDIAVDRGQQLGPSNIAAPWFHGGCSVIPIRADGTKSPMFQWKRGEQNFQEIPADLSLVREWFENRWPNAGVAVICGKVSGNLELLELEGRAYSDENIALIEQACRERGIYEVWRSLVTQSYVELSPAGGLHILYRITDLPVPGNEKVATRPARDDELNESERAIRQQNPQARFTRVLVETRGEGGYVVVAPTGGNCHPSGEPWITLVGTPGQFIQISWDQRCLIHQAIKSVLHIPDPNEHALAIIPRAQIIERDPNAPLTPVEDFNARSSWHDSWFIEQGWRVHHQDGTEIFWTRPGKDWGDGHSASTGVRDGGQDCLYVWSTSTGLPVEVPLTKFMVYAHYKFDGNRSLAARSLIGHYGAPLHPPAIGELRDEDLEIHEDQELSPVTRDYDLDNLRYDQSGGNVLTDTGYALRTRDTYLDRIRFNRTTKDWFVFHGGAGKWGEDCYFFADNAVQKIVADTYTWVKSFQAHNQLAPNIKEIDKLVKKAQGGYDNTRIQAILSRLRTAEGIAVTTEDFDANLELLNVQNGTLNLTTLQLKPHDPADMLTMSFNAEYDPDAECPNFLKYLEDVFPNEEVRLYIQRAVGYSLLGKPVERAIFILHGPSGTGKSVFTDVMTELFGDYGTTAPASTFKMKKQDSFFDLHQLRGRRFVSASEMSQRMEMDEELVKRLASGGDRVQSRGLYEKFVEWDPRCVIWLATNHLPRITSDDDAMWRRVRTIPMKTVVKDRKEEIKGFSAVLIQEANGLLNWALDGLRSYRHVGLVEPDVILADIIAYREDADTVASWLNYMILESTLQMDPEARCTPNYLYNSYENYCSSTGETKFGRPRFAKRLESLHPDIKLITLDNTRWVYGVGQTKGLQP